VSPSALSRVLRAAADACDQIAAEASAERHEWVDQRASLLGPRRHCRAVQARIAAGSGDAAIVGRRQLLSHAAHAAELSRRASRETPTKKLSVAEELRAELRLVGAAR
jgi:hypothetical protein